MIWYNLWYAVKIKVVFMNYFEAHGHQKQAELIFPLIISSKTLPENVTVTSSNENVLILTLTS